MGASGINLFDDDTACDTLSACLYKENPFCETFKNAFLEIHDSDFLDSDEANEILVYAFLLTALIDISNIHNLTDDELAKPYRESVLKFVGRHQDSWNSMSAEQKNELIEQAKKCFPLIKDPQKSELRLLWGESKDYLSLWLDYVDTIYSKLKKY